MYVMVEQIGKSDEGKNLYQKTSEGIKLFPNTDGTYGNKPEKLKFVLEPYPHLLKDGEKFGYTKEVKTSKGVFYGVNVGKYGTEEFKAYVISKSKENDGKKPNFKK